LANAILTNGLDSFCRDKNNLFMKNIYWIYILQCANNSYYTGYTNNLQARYQAHLDGSSKCKYTRSFKPIKIAQAWSIEGEKSLAMKIERFIKRQTRADKLMLIEHPAYLIKQFPVKVVILQELADPKL
jgi:putative endonuclease